MKIITLNSEELNQKSKELSDIVAHSDFHPDLILGVETGGRIIAENVFKHLTLRDSKLVFCHPKRKISNVKKTFLARYLKLLPTWLLDKMRILESKLLFGKKNRNNFQETSLHDEIGEFNKILVIDDAVDSGYTLLHIKNSILQKNPDADIKFAVFTVTKNNPILHPHFFLFKNTLIRFPWSIDSKKD